MDKLTVVWSRWHRHDGSGMPAPCGVSVQVITLPPHFRSRAGRPWPMQATGVAGVTIRRCWRWTLSDRMHGCAAGHALPADLFRYGLLEIEVGGAPTGCCAEPAKQFPRPGL